MKIKKGGLFMYVLTDSQGTYIRKDGNRYVPVKSAKSALVWDDAKKAEKVLRNQLSGKIKTHYKVASVDEIVVNTNSDVVHTEAELSKVKVQKWSDRINSVATLFNDAKARYDELSYELSTVDKKVTDIQHYIEFNNLNACEGWKCCNLLQQLLRQRRVIKDERDIVKKIVDANTSNSQFEALQQNVSTYTPRVYTPRVMVDLFKTKNIMTVNV